MNRGQKRVNVQAQHPAKKKKTAEKSSPQAGDKVEEEMITSVTTPVSTPSPAEAHGSQPNPDFPLVQVNLEVTLPCQGLVRTIRVKAFQHDSIDVVYEDLPLESEKRLATDSQSTSANVGGLDEETKQPEEVSLNVDMDEETPVDMGADTTEDMNADTTAHVDVDMMTVDMKEDNMTEDMMTVDVDVEIKEETEVTEGTEECIEQMQETSQ